MPRVTQLESEWPQGIGTEPLPLPAQGPGLLDAGLPSGGGTTANGWTPCQIHQLPARGPSTPASLRFWTESPALHPLRAVDPSAVLMSSEMSPLLRPEQPPSGLLPNPAPPSDQSSPDYTPGDAGSLAVPSYGLFPLSSQGKTLLPPNCPHMGHEFKSRLCPSKLWEHPRGG